MDKTDYTLIFIGILSLIAISILVTTDFSIDDKTIITINKPSVEKVPVYYNLDDPTTTYILEDDIFKEVEILNG